MTDLKPNAELAYKVLDHIDARPELWRQGIWLGESECGTTACFAGWAVMLSGCEVDVAGEEVLTGPAELIGRHVGSAAEVLLGIEDLDGDSPDPFDAILTRAELGRAVAEIFGPRPVTDAHRDDACRAIAAELDRHPDAL